MYKLNDLSGQRFGRLIVMEQAGRSKDRHILWKCVCDCGNYALASGRDLLSGHTQSCGCLLMDRITKHGGRSAYNTERLYFVWRGMKARCECKSATGYEYYGGRGIKVCDEWQSYSDFRKWAYDNGYDPFAETHQCSIDRIDVDGNYEPSNCRWVDAKVQTANRRVG